MKTILWPLFLNLTCRALAADEAERQVWLFCNDGEASVWNGNGPLRLETPAELI